MDRKNKSWPGENTRSSMTENVAGHRAEPLQVTSLSSSPQLDFLSPEFNVVDDLDDNIGNYRTFQSLDGIVTSDMRHHEERKKIKNPPQEKSEESNGDRKANYTAVEPEGQSPALPLTILSRGRTLIIDPDITTALRYGELLNEQGLNCTLCVPGNDSSNVSFSRTGSLPVIEVEAVTVSGSFGGFTVSSAACGKPIKLSTLAGDEIGFFDLVLDLQPTPSFTGKLLPAGYYAPGKTADIDETLAELPEMRGRFTKPQFTVLHEKSCLHGRSHAQDCRRCLEICPVGAITSVDRKIAFDPYLCQGCGGCSLVCPADAVRMQSPPQEDLLSAIAGLVSDAAFTKTSPDLVLYDLKIDSKTLYRPAGDREDDRLFFGVEEVGRVGMDVLLVALASGAGRVTLVCDPESPAPIRKALEREAELTRIILQGLNFSADRIRVLISPSEKIDLENNDFYDKVKSLEPGWPLVPPAALPFAQDKRTLIRLAAHHLSEVSEVEQPSVSLPGDAPFGSIIIDATACSLCMACVGSCPSGALKASGEEPCISIVESLCHQCGLCMSACPENAIKMQPRLLLDSEAAETPTVLQKVAPFNCVECGAPFASQAMINRMQEKLSGHWMYSSDRQVRRLKMCRTCRTRDALTAGDYRS